jgi:formiminotetrahydrofolate cyclodeaminase
VTASHDHIGALTVSGLSDLVSGDSPAPGGGTVVGVVAGLAASLAAMAGRFALKRADDQATIEGLTQRADELRLRCCDLADDDMKAYAAFAAAHRMSTDDGRARREAMAAAQEAAAVPPAELAMIAREIAVIGLRLVHEGNPHLRSDACAAAIFASAASSVAAMLVGENTVCGDSQVLFKARVDAAAAASAARSATEAVELPEPMATL